MASTAYPPSMSHHQGRHPPAPPPPRSGSTSSPFGSSIHAPSPIRATNFKPMYDLPPTLNQHTSTGSSGSAGGAGGGGRTAGGLRLMSPPLVAPSSSPSMNSFASASTPPPQHQHHQSAGSASTSPGSRPYPSSSLHHPQPRPAYQSASSSSTPPPALRSPTPGGSASVFSKAPQNPSSPSPADISTFHDACYRFFYQQDYSAQRYIDGVLSSLPPSHRAAFTRVQAAVRTAYHADEETRKRHEFEVILRGTEPGGGLTVANRRDPKGKAARKERETRLAAFVKAYGGKNEIGPRPFLVALYTVLRLQAVGEDKGGAGVRRVEWEVDDAVWMEAGGRDFMIEAVAVVKGVLGFEDIPRTKPRRRRHQRPSNATRHATSSFSTAQSGSFSNPNPYSNSNGGGPSHRRPSELEELRPTPEDDEAGPLYDPRLRSQFSPPPPPSSGSGRRGKAPPIPSQQLLSSSASSVTNPLISSRPRASSDPFSDPYANMQQAAAASRLPPSAANRRGQAVPPPPPTRPHPTFLNLDGVSNTSGGLTSPLGPGGGGARSMSHSSSRGEPLTPNAEDFLIPSGAGGGGGRTFSHSAGTSPGSTGPLLGSAVDDEDLSSDEDGQLYSPGVDDLDDDDIDPLLPRWRTWIAPANLSDPDLRRLCKLFPGHVSKVAAAKSTRLPYTGPTKAGGGSGATPKEMEEGLGGGASAMGSGGGGVVGRGEGGKRVGKGVLEGAGTGRMWKGEKERDAGWKGGWWQRFVGWLGGCFGR